MFAPFNSQNSLGPEEPKKPIPPAEADYSSLVGGVSELLESARRASARTVNAFMTATYWEVGRRTVEFEQGGEKRAEYGNHCLIVWRPTSIHVSAVVSPGAIFNPCGSFRVSFLQNKFGRRCNKAALLVPGAKPQPGDILTADEEVKDQLVLEFLGLRDEYSESDLEDALIRHLEHFLLELGNDFAFVARQRRLRIDDEWFRVDLLLFHRRLRCLVVLDLKLGRFTHADAGQMHLYLNYAAKLDAAGGKPARRHHSLRRQRRSPRPLRHRYPHRFPSVLLVLNDRSAPPPAPIPAIAPILHLFPLTLKSPCLRHCHRTLAAAASAIFRMWA